MEEVGRRKGGKEGGIEGGREKISLSNAQGSGTLPPDVDFLSPHLLVEVEEVEHDVHVQVPVGISLLYCAVVQQPPQQLHQRLNELHPSLLLHLGVGPTPVSQPV